MLADLELLVNMESPTKDKALVDQAMEFVIRRFQELTGGVVERISQARFGDQVKLHLGIGTVTGTETESETAIRQILVLGHVDTVWPAGETAHRPFSKDAQRAYGPGVFDMKCGLIQAIYAISALVKQHKLAKNIVFFINSDEEMGSRSSREWIEKEALKSDAVFVLEPALGASGALKTERKGVARFTLDVQGVSSHSGIDHRKGINALEELAYQIIYLQGLTDYSKDSTVNVGIASGGSAVNVVCDHAKAEFELRVQTISEMERLVHAVRNMQPKLKGTTLQVQGGVLRPPMERKYSEELYTSAKGLAQQLGFSLKEASTGGASDGNFTAALGVPTLDGLGAVGDGAHALHEYVEIEQIAKRCALLAHLMWEQCK
ncbi:M20 family metallopeptidase [Paenibacillus sp. S3N08]|uniref:M20 family metallopeptidase n=2 Tax=Paenibacillus agricola TaxID=2716264 RepID=A0ABX0J6T1_9BACL|nr:M20 family metallopeptidase [Paenibacillus agricola]